MTLPTFTSTYDKTVYNYVDKWTRETVVARTVVDFGVVDKKNRAVGMSRFIQRQVITLLTTEPSEDDLLRGHSLWRVGKPTDFFSGHAMSTRNGDGFGSAEVYVTGASLEEVAAELDKRIERARKIAVKKFA